MTDIHNPMTEQELKRVRDWFGNCWRKNEEHNKSWCGKCLIDSLLDECKQLRIVEGIDHASSTVRSDDE